MSGSGTRRPVGERIPGEYQGVAGEWVLRCGDGARVNSSGEPSHQVAQTTSVTAMTDSALDSPIPQAIPVTTAFEIPGHRIDSSLGLTWGVLVRSVGFAKGFTGGFRALKAGEVPQYTDVVDQARREAIERLIAHAQSLGANAVIGLRFDSSDVAENLAEILAYGTAVVVSPTS